MLREKRKWRHHKCESTEARHRGGVTRSSEEGSVMGSERRGYIVQLNRMDNQIWEDSFETSKVV
jgi:hypothetical protein